jgi:hypothetical protein
MKSLFPLLLFTAVVQAAPTASAPATLSKEGDLMTIVLTPEAEERLRLKVVAVERRAVPASRLFAGEVVRPLAANGSATAPVLGGTLEETLRLADLQAAADGRVLQAQTQVDAAKVALDRAEKVLSAEAGSARSVDEAKATLALADAALRTARAQRELLGTPVGPAGQGRRLWIRASIYSGETALLDPKADAMIRAITSTGAGQPAKPVAGSLTANALTSTIDWYYELPANHAARAGERVAVDIPLAQSSAEKLVLPFSAVLHDIHGGQWVYEAIAPHTYARRRSTSSPSSRPRAWRCRPRPRRSPPRRSSASSPCPWRAPSTA